MQIGLALEQSIYGLIVNTTLAHENEKTGHVLGS